MLSRRALAGWHHRHGSVCVRIKSVPKQIVPSILDPVVNDAGTEIADGAASGPRGFESFLEMGLPFVLIGWVDHPRFELSIELLERRQLLKRVQVPVIATLESSKRLPVVK